jgi:hypothetical protein
MKSLGIAVLVLIVATTAAAFDNPDGPPGSVGITPSFSYLWDTSGKYTEKFYGVTIFDDDIPGYKWSASNIGVDLIIPVQERVTLFGAYQYAWSAREQEYDWDDVIGNETWIKDNYAGSRFQFAVRFYLGGD